MKRVLIIDDSPFFRNYVQEKLESEKITVEISLSVRDGYSKILSFYPDVIIFRYTGNFEEMLDFLKRKKSSMNASKVPIIIYGPSLQKEQAAQLVLYDVTKYFSQPVKLDLFFESIGKYLLVGLPTDRTPSILEVRVNDTVIFIEIAQGLNRDKIGLLKYRIPELIKQHNLKTPKVVVMLTDLALTFIDGVNLELLLDSVISDSQIKNKNIKVLSLDPFTKSFIQGHLEYSGIDVVTNLADVMGALMKKEADSDEYIPELISETFLQSTDDIDHDSRLHVHNDHVQISSASAHILHIALLEDGLAEEKIFREAEELMSARLDIFSDVTLFFSAAEKDAYDVIIINLDFKNNFGWSTLQTLKQKNSKIPIFTYAKTVTKETLIKALNLGSRGFLLTPLKSEVIVKKIVEALSG